MNIFNFNARELLLLSAIIADQIALDYGPEEQELISVFFRSIAENISLYASTETLREINEESNLEKKNDFK